ELFQQKYSEVPVTVEHHSFVLAPNMPEKFDGDEADYLEKYEGVPKSRSSQTLPQIEKVAESEGIPFRFNDLVQVNTTKAHRVVQRAKLLGKAETLLDAFFAAYFLEQRDLSDPNTLAEISESVGLPSSEALAAVESDELDEGVRADHVRAQMLGANGVPFF